MSEPPAGMFAPLKKHKYMSLTTFRRGGVPVSTPVWFAEKDGRLYVRTARASGKIKRIHRDPIVTVAPCTGEGKPLAPPLPGKARILPPEEADSARQILARKYPVEKGLLGLLRLIVRRKEDEQVFLEISPI